MCRSPTAYLLLYSPDGCMAWCRYCTQSRSSRCSRRLLSRVTWPLVELEHVLAGLWRFRHVCLQCVLKPGFAYEALGVVRAVRRSGFGGTVSVAINPVGRGIVERLADHVDYIGVGLDACSPRVFSEMLKPYTWSVYLDFAKTCSRVLGEGMVSVHLIVGLGETPREYLQVLEWIYSSGCRAALFAYTPLPCLSYRGGRPGLRYYRWCQLARRLAEEGLDPAQYLDPDSLCIRREPPERVYPVAFLTSGCPHCTRPYYNESPRDTRPYNYPSVEPLADWRSEVEVLRGC
ncbi:MAG: radical SAM protein [Crenarchaeota archaeon]|nr:radical SAM protein [Thermoproteota archaeon]